MVKYSVTLKEADKIIGTYRLDETMFMAIEKQVAPFRSHAALSKPVKCIETGVIFENAKSAAKWLYDINATSSVHADVTVKRSCKGKQSIAHGYHWEYVNDK